MRKGILKMPFVLCVYNYINVYNADNYPKSFFFVINPVLSLLYS